VAILVLRHAPQALNERAKAPITGAKSLDRRPRARHNQTVPRQTVLRAGAVALLIALGLATYANALCSGWRTSAAERMACCERSGHSCASVGADDCCADGEQRQNVEGAATVFIPSDAALMRWAPLAVAALHCRVADARAPVTHPDAYLLDSVLLI